VNWTGLSPVKRARAKKPFFQFGTRLMLQPCPVTLRRLQTSSQQIRVKTFLQSSERSLRLCATCRIPDFAAKIGIALSFAGFTFNCVRMGLGVGTAQLQSREGHWVIVDLVGKGRRLRTVPVPSWCKDLLDAWVHHSGVSDGRVFRRLLKGGTRQEQGCDSERGLVCREAMCLSGWPDQPRSSRSSSHLRPALPWLWRRTRTDSVSARPRFGANNRAVHRKQTEASRCGE
jgi:integrase